MRIKVRHGYENSQARARIEFQMRTQKAVMQ